MVGLAAVAELDCDRRFGSARIVYFGCINRATIAKSVSAAATQLMLPLTDEGSAAIDSAVAQDLSPDDMPGLRASTQVRLAQVLTRRVLNSLFLGLSRRMTI